MVMPPPQLSLEGTDILLKENEAAEISFGQHNLPHMVASGYDYDTTQVETNNPLYIDGITVPIIDITEAQETYIENEDFTLLTDLTSTSKPLAEKITGETGKLELFADFTNDSYITTTELSEKSKDFSDYIESIKNKKHLKNENITVTTESPADIVSNYNVDVHNSQNVDKPSERIVTAFGPEENIFTTNIPSSGENTDNQIGGTWKERDVHQSSSDTISNEEYGDISNQPIFVDIIQKNASAKEYYRFVTLLTASGDSTDILRNDEVLATPQSSGISPDIANYEEYESLVTSATNVSDESLPTDIINNTNSDEQYVLLEASPITEVVLDTTQNPFDDIGSFDLKIMTTIEGLKVDVHDAVFDPSQIAKATSYEGSSYSTATRSATVTTWVDPDNRHLISQQHANLTQSKILGSSQKSETVVKLVENIYNTKVPDSDIVTNYLAKQDSEMKLTDFYQDTTNDFLASSDTVASDVKLRDEIKTEFTSLASEFNDNGYLGREDTVTTKNDVFDNDVNNVLEGIPILTYNVTDFGSGTQIQTKNGRNKTKDSLMYEIPLADADQNGIQLNPSVIIALSICCSIVVLLGIVSILLWLCRRHRNKSKVYLSHETVKPRAFLTKPMNPALLPSENIPDSLNMLEFQRPRAPLLLSDDKKDIYFIEQSSVNESSQLENTAVYMEDNGFIDIPLSKFKTGTQTKVYEPDPPKYGLKSKCESDSDSGIKMWSSTGSLYTSSSQLNHCSVPPPPYSSSMAKETFYISVHSLPSLSKKTEMLDV